MGWAQEWILFFSRSTTSTLRFFGQHTGAVTAGLLTSALLLGVGALVWRRRSFAGAAWLVAALLVGLVAIVQTAYPPNTPPYWLPVVLSGLLTLLWLPLEARWRAPTTVSATREEGSTPGERRVSPYSLAHIVLFAVVAFSCAGVYALRLTDFPELLDPYGGVSGAGVAKRLVDGKVDVGSMILFREMTQEECVYSLPFMAWLGLFQLLTGGQTIFAARLASATAILVSLVLIYRTARRLLSPGAGLIAMAVFGTIPATILNARMSRIYAFSTMLLLIVVDVAVGFVKKPTWPRAVLLGLVSPLVAYGIANIRIGALAVACLVVAYFVADREFRRLALRRLPVSLLVLGVLLIPQIRHYDVVARQVQGRGEHIFSYIRYGSLFSEQTQAEIKRTLVENLVFFERISWGQGGTFHSIPPLTTILMLLGVSVCIATIRSPDRLFLLLFWLTAYLGPLIAVPFTPIRTFMFATAQALMVAVFLNQIWLYFRASRARFVVGSVLVMCTIVVCAYQLAGMTELLQRTQRTKLVEFLESSDHGGLVFFASETDSTLLPTVRQSSPALGRDFKSRMQVLGMRFDDIIGAAKLAQALDIDAMIVGPPQIEPFKQLANESDWKVDEISPELGALVRKSTAENETTAVAIEPIEFTAQDPPFPAHALLWPASETAMVRVVNNLRIAPSVSIPEDFDRFAVIVRTGHNAPPPGQSGAFEIAVDGTLTCRAEMPKLSHIVVGLASCVIEAPLVAGVHSLQLSAAVDVAPGSQGPVITIDDITIVGVSRGGAAAPRGASPL